MTRFKHLPVALILAAILLQFVGYYTLIKKVEPLMYQFYLVAWWYVVFPALALLITTLAFNLLGDGVRDAMDPRTERVLAAGRGQRRRRRGQRQVLADGQAELAHTAPYVPPEEGS